MLNTLEACLKAVDEILLGKDRQVRLALACLLARGHLLIEDLPGMGKTTLSHALARVLGLSFQRIQFTSDLLPGDILGTSVFDKDSGQFVFHPGPIFAELVLADEINRATPKSQSALLEAMEEGQVTIEGATRPLPEPFFVIATQNPASQGGTFSLPESQLDRFLMRLSLGYPGRAAERSLLLGEARRDLLPRLEPLLDHAALAAFQAEVPKVRASDALVDYVLRLVEATRTQPAFSTRQRSPWSSTQPAQGCSESTAATVARLPTNPAVPLTTACRRVRRAMPSRPTISAALSNARATTRPGGMP
ncbi:ATPase AAA (plasmid) [Pseudomonas aeruginosa VRFPA03]|nr:ATPase AAA [Pseudomonas aeruginosa VRFPA03]